MARAAMVPALLALAALLAGCGNNPFAVARERGDAARAFYRVQLDLETSAAVAGPDRPLTALATVANTGSRDVFAGYDCSSAAIELTLIGPQGQAVRFRDPFAIGPMCPYGYGPFVPGQRGEAGMAFRGLLFTDAGEVYAAPEGTYTIVARFNYSKSMSPGPSEFVERARSFDWDLP